MDAPVFPEPVGKIGLRLLDLALIICQIEGNSCYCRIYNVDYIRI